MTRTHGGRMSARSGKAALLKTLRRQHQTRSVPDTTNITMLHWNS